MFAKGQYLRQNYLSTERNCKLMVFGLIRMNTQSNYDNQEISAQETDNSIDSFSKSFFLVKCCDVTLANINFISSIQNKIIEFSLELLIIFETS